MEHPYQIVLALILWQFMVSHGVLKCPESTEDWGRASMALQCKDPKYYHCLKDETGQITQQCLQRVWIQQSMCPEFNFKARRIDVYQCKSLENNCPTTTYWSNAVYLYPGCFKISSVAPNTTTSFSILFTTTAEITTKDSDSFKNTSTAKDVSNGMPNILIITISCVIVIFLLLGLVGIIVFKRRRSSESHGLNNGPGGGERTNQPSETEDMLPVQETSGLNNVPDVGERGHQSSETETVLRDSPDLRNAPDGGERANQPSETEHMLHVQESSGLNNVPDLGERCHQPSEPENVLRDSARLDNGSAPGGRERANQSLETEQMLQDLVKKLKDFKAERVIIILSNVPVDDSKIEREAMILGENAIPENDLNMWKKNKSKKMYIFKNWMLSDSVKCFDELKQVLVEMLQAVIQNDTKFIINFPLSVWHKDSTELQDILRDCAVFKYRYYASY